MASNDYWGPILGPVGGYSRPPRKRLGIFDDLLEPSTIEEAAVPVRQPSTIEQALDFAKRGYQAVEQAPTIAANYYSPGGRTVLSEGLTPQPPSIAELVERGGMTPDQYENPTYGEAIGRKVGGVAAELLASPTNWALIGATRGLGAAGVRGLTARAALEAGGLVPEAAAAASKIAARGTAARIGARAASLGFAGQMIPGAYEQIGQGIETARRDGFTPTAAGEFAGGGIEALMAAGALKHGLTPTKQFGPPRTIEEAAAQPRTRPFVPQPKSELELADEMGLPYTRLPEPRSTQNPIVDAVFEPQPEVTPAQVAPRPTIEPPVEAIPAPEPIVAPEPIPAPPGPVFAEPSPSRLAYRARNVGEEGIPEAGHSQASLSEADVRRLAPSRTEEAQEIVSTDLSKLKEGDEYVIHPGPGGSEWVQFKRPLSEAELTKGGPITSLDREAASKAEPPLRDAVAGAQPADLAKRTGLSEEEILRGQQQVRDDGLEEFKPEAIAVKRAVLEGVQPEPLSTESGQAPAAPRRPLRPIPPEKLAQRAKESTYPKDAEGQPIYPGEENLTPEARRLLTQTAQARVRDLSQAQNAEPTGRRPILGGDRGNSVEGYYGVTSHKGGTPLEGVSAGPKEIAAAMKRDKGNPLELEVREAVLRNDDQLRDALDDTWNPEAPKFSVRPIPGQRGLEGIAEDVAPKGPPKKEPPAQEDLFGKGAMLQPSAPLVSEGREAEGSLFSQDRDRLAKEEAGRQTSLPKYSVESDQVPPKGPGDKAAEPTKTPGGGDFEEFSRQPLVRIAGEDIDPDFFHGTKRKNVKTLAGTERPESSLKPSVNPIFDRVIGRELNEFGAAILLSEQRQPQQAHMFAQGDGQTLAVVRMRAGTRILDLSDEATRAPTIGFGEPEVLRFFKRPAITDDFIDWRLGKISDGYKERNPDWAEIIRSEMDPSSPDFTIRSWRENLVPYAKERGYGAIRLADETLVTDRSVLESAREATSHERQRAATHRRYKSARTGSLFTNEPTGAYKEAWERKRSKPDVAPQTRGVKPPTPTAEPGRKLALSVSEKAGDVGEGKDTTKFATDTYERDLTAQHNLTAENLLQADKMGGFPHPSVAITKKDIGFNDYGDITLVGRRDLVAPEADYRNKVYSADAYSPRIPEAEYKQNRRVRDAFFKSKMKAMEGGPNHPSSAWQVVSDARDPRKAREEFDGHYSDAFKRAFLREQGVEPLTYTREKNWDPRTHIEEREYREALDKQLADAGLTEKYGEWADAAAESMYGEPTMKLGGRKVDYTLENVDAALSKTSVRAKEHGMTFGPGSARAAGTREFKSVPEMHAAKDSLVTDKEIAAMKEAQGPLHQQYRDLALEHYRENDTWSGLDDSYRAIGDYIKGGKGDSPERMRRALSRRGFRDLTDELVSAGMAVAKDLRGSKTQYFEGKPRRAVKFEEFAGAVIPKDTPAKVRAVLERRGIPYKEYERYNSESRQAAVEALREEQNRPDNPTKFSAQKGFPDFQDRQALRSRLQKTFSSLRVQETKDGYVLPTPSGKRILVTPKGEIHFPAKALEQGHGAKAAEAYEKGELSIAGMTYRVGKDVAIDIADGKFLPHESLHVFLDNFASSSERKLIREKWEAQAKQEGRAWDETAGDEYVRWFDKPESKTPMGKFFTRVRDFFLKIKDALLPSAEGVFRKVQSGDPFTRTSKQVRGGPKFATAPAEPPRLNLVFNERTGKYENVNRPERVKPEPRVMGRSMVEGEAPRVEAKVASLREAAPATKLSRDAPRTWESLDPEIRDRMSTLMADSNKETAFYEKAKSGKLNDVDVQTLDALVRFKRENYDVMRERLLKAQESGGDTGAENVEYLKAAFDHVTADLVSAARSDVEAGTKLGRALAARARVMEAAQPGASEPHIVERARKHVASAVDNHWADVIRKMKEDGVLRVECD